MKALSRASGVVHSPHPESIGNHAQGARLWRVKKKEIVLLASLGAEILVITALSLPSLMLFRNFAFADWGTNFTLEYLLSKGLRPNIDFGYPYGTLALWCGHLWFSAAGFTPRAYVSAMVLCNLLVAWAFARVIVQLELRGASLLLVFAGLPYAVQLIYPNFSQAIESALLANALAEQARGRRSFALALTTAACFAKPSLGYVYGLILILLILWALYSDHALTLRSALAELAPAGITAMCIFAIIALAYSVKATALTLLPLAGAANYRAFHYGFFTGMGRLFWWPNDAGWGYYLTTVAGFWIIGTIWLLMSGAVAAYRLWLVKANDQSLELVTTCAVLQLAFITLMFGSRLYWMYYTYILLIGLAATSVVFASAPGVIRLLTVLAVFGHTATVSIRWYLPSRLQASADTAGLLATGNESNEWKKVCALAKGHQTAVATDLGSASLMFPDFAKPTAAHLLPGIALSDEVEREARRLERAKVIIVHRNDFPGFVPIADALNGTTRVFEGDYFTVYERTRTK
jgi:hypothetical protein